MKDLRILAREKISKFHQNSQIFFFLNPEKARGLAWTKVYRKIRKIQIVLIFLKFDLSFGDLVMPWFLFMSGVSIRFALVSRTKKGLTKEKYKILRNLNPTYLYPMSSNLNIPLRS